MQNYCCRIRFVIPAPLFVAGKVASNRVADALAAESSRLSLARIGIDALPGDLTASNRVTHITVLDLKHNALQIFPSELFLCVSQLEEVDASKVRETHIPSLA